MKRILAATTIAALLATAALAETTTTTPKADTPLPTATTSMAKTDSMFYAERGEWRASKLMGANVTNNAGEKIGRINDVLIDKDGKVAAVVIGVGGFLSMGERDAAVAYSSLKLTRDSSNNPLVSVNLTKDQLKAAPEWKWQPAS